MVALGQILPELNIASKHQKHEAAKRSYRDYTAELDSSCHDQRVLVLLRIVVIAVSQNICYRRSDFVARGIDQPQQNVFGRVLHAEIILSQFTLRSSDLYRAGMRELRQLAIGPGNADVTEAYSTGNRIDVGNLTREEMPAVRRLLVPVPFQIESLLLCSQRGRVFTIFDSSAAS